MTIDELDEILAAYPVQDTDSEYDEEGQIVPEEYDDYQASIWSDYSQATGRDSGDIY